MYESDGEAKSWKPTRHKIANLMEALAAIAHLPETIDQPSYIGPGPQWSAVQSDVVSVSNGLLDLERREWRPHTPAYFHQTAVPFEYDPDAPAPSRWLRFLGELWPSDTPPSTHYMNGSATSPVVGPTFTRSC